MKESGIRTARSNGLPKLVTSAPLSRLSHRQAVGVSRSGTAGRQRAIGEQTGAFEPR
jgi:hypothetical protein